MNESASFFDSNYNTVIHAKYFLIKHEKWFNWTTSEDILEIGCANGNITKNILYPIVKDHLHHLTGSDISDSAIEYAKKSNNIPNLSFQTLDITNVDECNNYIEKYHRIFAFYVFHITHEPELWSTNIFKMLKPKGQIFGHTVVNHPNFYNVITSDQRNDQSKPWCKYMKNVRDVVYDFGAKPLKKMKEILSKAGFIIDVIDIEPKKLYFKDFTDLRNSFLSANHFLNNIPEELHADYKNDFMKKLLKEIRCNNDGSYEFIHYVLVFLATKP